MQQTSRSDSSPSHNEASPALFLRMPSVVRMTGLCRSTIYRLISENKFPPPLDLRGVREPCVAVQRAPPARGDDERERQHDEEPHARCRDRADDLTYAAGGLTFQIGKGIPDVFGASAGTIPSTVVLSEAYQPKAAIDPPSSRTSCLFDWLQCSAFGSLEVRAVVFNVFLDGRLGENDPHITKRPIVADAIIGARLDLPRTRNSVTGPWFVQFRSTYRTAEFKSMRPVPAQRFGAVTVGTDF